MTWRETWQRIKSYPRWEQNGQITIEEPKPKPSALDQIVGHEEIKYLVRRALASEDSFNMLLVGAPASAKSMFLKAICEENKKAVYLDGTNTTNAIFDLMEQERPQVICIDEFEKMSRNYQEKLLNFMEDGRVKVTQKKVHYDFEIKGAKVFATANILSKVTEPMRSRFYVQNVPPYSEEEFVQVAKVLLSGKPPQLVEFMARKVFGQGGDIRKVKQIGKLIQMKDTEQDVLELIERMR